MFERARLKLTAWYLVIIMAICLLFSVAIYSNINVEFRRFERFQERVRDEESQFLSPLPHPRLSLDPQMIREARMRVITSLGIFNLIILIIAGGAGYFLAGRTLRPIRIMVDEQNRFVTDASHELRTPLTSLRSQIEVNLRNKNFTIQDAKKILESNLEEVLNLQVLSDNLLELAQNGKTLSPTNMTETPVIEIIKAALKKVEPLAKKKKIIVKKQLAEATALSIPDRLTEVLVILLDNAIKYSPAKSTITVRSEKKDNYAILSVKDQGLGITEEEMPHIFERFYRANQSRSKVAMPGYGLGLSIAKKIIDAHQGSITVSSERDKGSTFTIRLPLA